MSTKNASSHPLIEDLASEHPICNGCINGPHCPPSPYPNAAVIPPRDSCNFSASFGKDRWISLKIFISHVVRVWNDQWIGLRENFNRKTPYLMGKSMVSCKFSLKQIHWHQGWFSKHLFSTLPKQRFEELHCGSKPNAASTASFFGFRWLESPGYVSPAAQSCLLCWLRGLSNRHCPPS
jgi:hypothetical protein